MDVYIHADKRLAAGNPQNKMRALWPHARKGHQDLGVTWDLSVVFIEYAACDGKDLTCLALVKCARADQRIQFLIGQFADFSRSTGALEEFA